MSKETKQLKKQRKVLRLQLDIVALERAIKDTCVVPSMGFKKEK